MTSFVFPLCVKRTIGPSCQVAMFLIGVKRQAMSIPLPTQTPIRACHASNLDTYALASIASSNVQISGGPFFHPLSLPFHQSCLHAQAAQLTQLQHLKYDIQEVVTRFQSPPLRLVYGDIW